MSTQRYVLLAFVIIAVLMGFTMKAALVSAFLELSMPDNRVGGLLQTSVLGGVVSGVVCFIALIRSRIALQFAGEVVGELLKVTWPTRDETVRASTTVVFTTLFTAGLLSFYDLIWKNVANWVLYTNS